MLTRMKVRVATSLGSYASLGWMLRLVIVALSIGPCLGLPTEQTLPPTPQNQPVPTNEAPPPTLQKQPVPPTETSPSTPKKPSVSWIAWLAGAAVVNLLLMVLFFYISYTKRAAAELQRTQDALRQLEEKQMMDPCMSPSESFDTGVCGQGEGLQTSRPAGFKKIWTRGMTIGSSTAWCFNRSVC